MKAAAKWCRAFDAGDSSQSLRTIFEQASSDFVRLITSLPDLLERYEGVSEDGATVRRIAILNDDTEVFMEGTTLRPTFLLVHRVL